MVTAQEKRPLNVVFMGTPDFAATALDAVLASGLATVDAVYTQPDRPCGRGHKCQPSAVKRLALERGLAVMQPAHFKDAADVAALAALAPDVLVVAAYGLILPQAVLDIPGLAPLNIHASLLPAYRGAAPIQRAIMNGETTTGITIMRMEAGLDTGPMLLAHKLAIGPDETAGSLHDRLAQLGGRAITSALADLPALLAAATPQDSAKATYAAKITKADGLLHFDDTCRNVHNRIRALAPKPGAAFFLTQPGAKAPLRLLAAPGRYVLEEPSATPGSVLGLTDSALSIACLDGTYRFAVVQPAGKKPMDATSFYCGYLNRLDPGASLICHAPAELLG